MPPRTLLTTGTLDHRLRVAALLTYMFAERIPDGLYEPYVEGAAHTVDHLTGPVAVHPQLTSA